MLPPSAALQCVLVCVCLWQFWYGWKYCVSSVVTSTTSFSNISVNSFRDANVSRSSPPLLSRLKYKRLWDGWPWNLVPPIYIVSPAQDELYSSHTWKKTSPHRKIVRLFMRVLTSAGPYGLRIILRYYYCNTISKLSAKAFDECYDEATKSDIDIFVPISWYQYWNNIERITVGALTKY